MRAAEGRTKREAGEKRRSTRAAADDAAADTAADEDEDGRGRGRVLRGRGLG